MTPDHMYTQFAVSVFVQTDVFKSWQTSDYNIMNSGLVHVVAIVVTDVCMYTPQEGADEKSHVTSVSFRRFHAEAAGKKQS